MSSKHYIMECALYVVSPATAAASTPSQAIPVTAVTQTGDRESAHPAYADGEAVLTLIVATFSS